MTLSPGLLLLGDASPWLLEGVTAALRFAATTTPASLLVDALNNVCGLLAPCMQGAQGRPGEGLQDLLIGCAPAISHADASAARRRRCRAATHTTHGCTSGTAHAQRTRQPPAFTTPLAPPLALQGRPARQSGRGVPPPGARCWGAWMPGSSPRSSSCRACTRLQRGRTCCSSACPQTPAAARRAAAAAARRAPTCWPACRRC